MTPKNAFAETSWEEDPDYVTNALSRVLPATEPLFERYDWELPFFDIDPHHHLVSIFASLAAMSERLPEVGNLLVHVLDAARRALLTPEARCKMLDAILAHLEAERALDVREQLRVLAEALRRPSQGLQSAALVGRFLIHDMGEAVRARVDREQADQDRSHPLIEGLIEEATGEDVDKRAPAVERLAGFGEEAVPFLARALPGGPAATDLAPAAAAPLLEALGRIGGRRALDRLVHALFLSDDAEGLDACMAALAAIGRPAAECLLDYVTLGIVSAPRRLWVYEALSRMEGVSFAPLALADLDENAWPPGQFTDAAFDQLVDLIVRSGDRRAVPILIRVLRRKQTPPARRDILNRRLQKSEWSDEVRLALRRLREGKPVFVDRDGVSQDQAKGGAKRDSSVLVALDVRREPFVLADAEDLGKRSATGLEEEIEVWARRYNCKPWVDCTGIGWGIVGNLEVPAVGVNFTSGRAVTEDDLGFNVPREKLLSNLAYGLEHDMLAIPEECQPIILALTTAQHEKGKGLYVDWLDALALAFWSATEGKAPVYTPGMGFGPGLLEELQRKSKGGVIGDAEFHKKVPKRKEGQAAGYTVTYPGDEGYPGDPG